MKRSRRVKTDFLDFFFKVTAFGLLGYAAAKVLADDSEETDSGKSYPINELYKKQGGNPNASNKLGSGQFNYKRFLQLEVDPFKDRKRSINKNPVGIECKMSTAVFFLKSLGLLPPNMSRFEFEDELTHILDNSKSVPTKKKNSVYVIPKKWNAAMRGFSNADIQAAKGSIGGETNQAAFSDSSIVEIANNLRKTSYAKDRKMDKEELVRLSFANKNELVKGLQHGLVSLVSLHNEEIISKHYALAVSGICRDNVCRINLLDDPYQSIRWGSDTEMVDHYRGELGTSGLKNFWTLVPKSKFEIYKSLIKK